MENECTTEHWRTSASNCFEERPYGWVIVAVATICLAMGFGANITVSVFMKPFEEEFGWFRADISMAYTMLTIGAAFGGIAWGSLSDMIGAKRIGFIGVFVLSIGLIALRWQIELWRLYLLYFAIGAFGFACLFTPIVALAGLWFHKRKGFAIGVVTAGGAIGQGRPAIQFNTRSVVLRCMSSPQRRHFAKSRLSKRRPQGRIAQGGKRVSFVSQTVSNAHRQLGSAQDGR
jgi:sugar phosphate permease